MYVKCQIVGTKYIILKFYRTQRVGRCAAKVIMALDIAKNGDIIKHLLVTLCFLECLLLSGFIFGWSSLVYVYKELGYFSSYCSNHTANVLNHGSSSSADVIDGSNLTGTRRPAESRGECHEQDAALDLVFIIATVGSALCTLPLGAVIDRFGVNSGRVISG